MTTTPKKPSAPCSVCERRTYVRRDGKIGHHAGTEKGSAGFRKTCAGVGQPPAAVTAPESCGDGEP